MSCDSNSILPAEREAALRAKIAELEGELRNVDEALALLVTGQPGARTSNALAPRRSA